MTSKIGKNMPLKSRILLPLILITLLFPYSTFEEEDEYQYYDEEEDWKINYTLWTHPKSIDYKIFKWTFPETFGQFFLCYVQLMIIVGLCLDGGKSIFGRFFNTKPLQASLQSFLKFFLSILIVAL